VSDKKIAVMNGANLSYYRADVVSYSDYYPFGAPMTERTAVVTPTDVRYGFNGMEVDSEINGNGNAYDFGARMYDARLGRWWSVDPEHKALSAWSTYTSNANNPILFIDVEGKIFVVYTKVQDENGNSIKVKITFDGDVVKVYDRKSGEAMGVEYKNGMNKFVDDMVISYEYITKNSADVDGAMEAVAKSLIEVEVVEQKGKGMASYHKGKIYYDFSLALEIHDEKTDEYKGSQSPAIGFWSEVYHSFIDLIDVEAKETFKNDTPTNDNEEYYVHVTKENQVIDKLKEANPNSKETKRNSYEEGTWEKKVSSPTKTLEDE
jgi:RHS repeat-associated protein